jgi:tartrate dehydrogenase/decarboxylase/D-malate dehydrogenase
MFDHLGEHAAHDLIVAAITSVLSSGDARTPDMGGKANTREMAAAILGAV